MTDYCAITKIASVGLPIHTGLSAGIEITWPGRLHVVIEPLNVGNVPGVINLPPAG